MSKYPYQIRRINYLKRSIETEFAWIFTLQIQTMKFNVDFSLAKLTQYDKSFVFSLVILSVAKHPLTKLCFATKKNTQAMKIFVLQYSFAVVLEFWHDLSENLHYI